MIKLTHVDKRYRDHHALVDINLELPKEKTTVIVGPSGAGKSTLLRTLNLLEIPEAGVYQFDEDVIDFAKEISMQETLKIRRKTGMVFQSWNLFPHLTILENITEGPVHVLKVPQATADEKAAELLQLVGLPGMEKRYPAQLSGGQQQRISICRALAMNPEYVLFDEPTSALDPEVEAQVLKVMLNLAKQKQSMIVVTHNMEFAKLVADKMIFIENGQIEFTGTTAEFFDYPNERIEVFLSGMQIK